MASDECVASAQIIDNCESIREYTGYEITIAPCDQRNSDCTVATNLDPSYSVSASVHVSVFVSGYTYGC